MFAGFKSSGRNALHSGTSYQYVRKQILRNCATIWRVVYLPQSRKPPASTASALSAGGVKNKPRPRKETKVSVLHKSMAAGLMALTLTGTSIVTSAPAAAHDDFWGGVAAGAVGGVLLSQAVRPYPYTYGYPDGYGYPYAYGYRYGYPYRAYRPYTGYYGGYPVYRSQYRPYYYNSYRRCHTEWRRGSWGDSYRVRVCPY